MNKLSLIFIAVSLAVSAGLVFAQNQMNMDDAMLVRSVPEMNTSGHSMPVSDKPVTKTVTP